MHLGEVEHDKECQSRDDACRNGRIVPAPEGRLLETKHAKAHPGGDQDHAPVVHPGRLVLGDRLRDDDQRQGDERDGMFTQKIARQVHCVR